MKSLDLSDNFWPNAWRRFALNLRVWGLDRVHINCFFPHHITPLNRVVFFCAASHPLPPSPSPPPSAASSVRRPPLPPLSATISIQLASIYLNCTNLFSINRLYRTYLYPPDLYQAYLCPIDLCVPLPISDPSLTNYPLLTLPLPNLSPSNLSLPNLSLNKFLDISTRSDVENYCVKFAWVAQRFVHLSCVLRGSCGPSVSRLALC